MTDALKELRVGGFTCWPGCFFVHWGVGVLVCCVVSVVVVAQPVRQLDSSNTIMHRGLQLAQRGFRSTAGVSFDKLKVSKAEGQRIKIFQVRRKSQRWYRFVIACLAVVSSFRFLTLIGRIHICACSWNHA